MTSSVVRRLICVCAIVAAPIAAFAQEAVFSGTVTDSTGAILPGVTLRAVLEASGNSFEGVSDQRCAYRIPVRIGVYKLTAEIAGFTTVTRTGLELLVGQTAVINLQMAPASVQESVIVTAQSPLIETTTSSLGGNIDQRQVQELPSQGRNWMSLALLAPGNRTNAQGSLPVQDRVDVREFQLNVDGQQVTANLGTGNQSRYSNDSIAEFQFISNRFDATQGRSTGVQVNVVTKSGTNLLGGSLVGNFRDSAWNAADPVLKRVLPYKNQQISGTLGGPIVKNKLHFFGNYEYERQPLTSIWTTPYPRFIVGLDRIRNVKLAGARLDQQLSSPMRLMGKGAHSGLVEPFEAGTGNHPPATNSNHEHNSDLCGGVITANGGPVPPHTEALFPDPFNADTWNLAAISSITTRYTVGVSDSSAFLTPIHMWKYGAWAQDDWKVSNRLTLNLGLRYDLIWNAFAQDVTFEPFEHAGRPQDANNI